MNTKLGLAAIALFAVTLGMSMFPAAMAKADTTICHFAETEFLTDPDTGEVVTDPDTGEPIVVEEAHWMFLTLNNNGAVNGHLKNHGEDTDGDGVIDIPEFIVDENTPGNTAADCQALIDG